MKKEIESLKKVIDSGNKIVAITGAGISMSAGIKDMEHLDFFSTLQMMSETMLKMNPKHYYNIVRKGFLDAAFSSHGTVTHKKLAELEHNGKVTGIITTNIDCMHTLAGSVNVAEIQGSFQINKCLKCGNMYHDIDLWNRGNAPKCLKCGGAICPFPVYSKVGVYDPAIRKARKWISEADVILIIGSKGMYGNTYFQNRNIHAKIVQINPKNTGFENIAMLNIHNKTDEIFEHI